MYFFLKAFKSKMLALTNSPFSNKLMIFLKVTLFFKNSLCSVATLSFDIKCFMLFSLSHFIIGYFAIPFLSLKESEFE